MVVLDMQPIDPPVGGGRLRLLGLYHGLGRKLSTTYVGTYDWPGEAFRRHRLSETLEEIDVPLSDAHFGMVREWEARVGGKTIIDACFHQLAHLSREFLDIAGEQASAADVVIFSHPWIFPLVRESLDPSRQMVVYDSHNFEGLLRTSLLDDGHFGTGLVREVVRIEYELCHAADLVLACSHEDLSLFHRVYNIPYRKIRIVPNGVFTGKITPCGQVEKRSLKAQLGVRKPFMAVFIGSAYPPNVEGANFIIRELAPALPEVTFAVCGGVGHAVDRKPLESAGIRNVIVTGLLSEAEKERYLKASDIAVNPMFSGSGTNIKMFDFMAAALPVVTTPVGARGIAAADGEFMRVCAPTEFVAEIGKLMRDADQRAILGESARRVCEERFSWERISTNLGTLLERFHTGKRGGKRPYFSVVIPTFERHDRLTTLMGELSAQTWKDFEAIIVDQSPDPWPDMDRDFKLDLLYIHTPVRGAVKARNLAGFLARGEVLAFTDDDCEPRATWLANARPYFEDEAVVGVEGLVKSKNLGDPNYRTVTNKGFEGLGFMTCNLFVRLDVFNAINGFDEAFDHPHFREDTDLGWRALEWGDIPFATDVEVFHPPHRRNIRREAHAERVKFFIKDALLLKKHPKRYMQLFLAEGHWASTPGFWENFLEGAKKYGVQVPEEFMHYRGSAIE